MRSLKNKNNGVYVVEFAIISALFILTILLVLEGIRYMYVMNAASEVTRRGARMATVCGLNAPGIDTEMTSRLSILTPSNIKVDYLPSGCSAANCLSVAVGLQNLTTTVIGITVNIPDFTTTLPRESMDSSLNPSCS